MINVFEPTFGEMESKVVRRAMDRKWTGRGPVARNFENAFAEYHNLVARQCLSITSCTDGLFLAIQALEIGPGDEVVIPTIHFAGAANAVLAAGATPVFCDVHIHSLNIGFAQLRECVNEATRAVIILHYGGSHPEDMLAIADFCSDRGIYLIEDCACSIGSYEPVVGDIAVWSFDSMKIITTGDGGMIYSSENIIERIRLLAYLGMDSRSGASSNRDRWWEFHVILPGARHLMNDLSASIGLVQLEHLPRLLKKRWEVIEVYDRMLEGVSKPRNNGGVPYFYWIQTPHRDTLAKELRDRYDIYTTFRYYPLHKAFRSIASLPAAEQAARSTLLLPLHANVADPEYIAGAVNSIIGELNEQGET